MTCPDCIEEMKPDRKRLGLFTVWMVCPHCGYRARPTHIQSRDIERAVADIHDANARNLNPFGHGLN